MKKYDVIIVGCGPAGASAAKILKQNNINYCMIEKNIFPREKLCGGGLTNKSVLTLKKLGFIYDEINSRKSSQIQLVAKNLEKKMKLLNDIIMIDRAEFDYNNIKQVVSDNLFEKEKIIGIDNNILSTDKDKYEFKYIIFADGVNGYSRRMIKDKQFGFCVEYKSEKIFDKTVLDFCAIEGGYGWIFPKANHTTIGLGNANTNKEDYISLLCNFAQKYGFEIDKKDIRGYHIPIFSEKVYKQTVVENKYIIVGDAGSLVDRISGEGIYYALYSGMKAAESIVLCLNDEGKNLKDTYFEKTKNICNSLKKRNFLSKLLYSRHGTFFIKLGLSNKYFEKRLNRMLG